MLKWREAAPAAIALLKRGKHAQKRWRLPPFYVGMDVQEMWISRVMC